MFAIHSTLLDVVFARATVTSRVVGALSTSVVFAVADGALPVSSQDDFVWSCAGCFLAVEPLGLGCRGGFPMLKSAVVTIMTVALRVEVAIWFLLLSGRVVNDLIRSLREAAYVPREGRSGFCAVCLSVRCCRIVSVFQSVALVFVNPFLSTQ